MTLGPRLREGARLVSSGTRMRIRILQTSRATRALCAGVCLALLALPASAFDSSKPLTEYTHTVWTHRDGIPSAFIYSIAQTRDGYLWLPTRAGVGGFGGAPFSPGG